MLRILRVSEESLSPQFQEGDFVLIAKIPFFLDSYQPGDVVVFHHPLYGMLIKRVERIDQQKGEVFVVGTHPSSVDSRHFGPVRIASLLGKVIWHLKRPQHPTS